jgi:hypothetical protein
VQDVLDHRLVDVRELYRRCEGDAARLLRLRVQSVFSTRGVDSDTARCTLYVTSGRRLLSLMPTSSSSCARRRLGRVERACSARSHLGKQRLLQLCLGCFQHHHDHVCAGTGARSSDPPVAMAAPRAVRTGRPRHGDDLPAATLAFGGALDDTGQVKLCSTRASRRAAARAASGKKNAGCPRGAAAHQLDARVLVLNDAGNARQRGELVRRDGGVGLGHRAQKRGLACAA